jgi:hypothetical protein
MNRTRRARRHFTPQTIVPPSDLGNAAVRMYTPFASWPKGVAEIGIVDHCSERRNELMQFGI